MPQDTPIPMQASDDSPAMFLPKDPVNSARYIATMARELQLVALRSELGMLNYLLGIVVLEAELLLKGHVAGE